MGKDVLLRTSQYELTLGEVFCCCFQFAKHYTKYGKYFIQNNRLRQFLFLSLLYIRESDSLSHRQDHVCLRSGIVDRHVSGHGGQGVSPSGPRNRSSGLSPRPTPPAESNRRMWSRKPFSQVFQNCMLEDL